MTNLLSYYGLVNAGTSLVNARISASEKDLPVCSNKSQNAYSKAARPKLDNTET